MHISRQEGTKANNKTVSLHFSLTEGFSRNNYRKTSVARTLMARLPRLFRTRSWVPRKKSLGCRFGIALCDSSLFWKRYIVCTHKNRLNEAILMRTHNISPCKENQRDPYYASWPGAIINPQWLELPLSWTNFHGPKGDRAIEVRLYLQNIYVLRLVLLLQLFGVIHLVWFFFFLFWKRYLHVKKIKEILIMPPDLALLSTLNGSNYRCLELIFMVPKVIEPLKFDSTYKISMF